MIQGTVSDTGVPTITLSIAEQEWTATIDTGFNGDLELPEALRKALNPQYIGEVTSVLAGGQTIVEELYRVNFLFDGKMIPAEAQGYLVLHIHFIYMNMSSSVGASCARDLAKRR